MCYAIQGATIEVVTRQCMIVVGYDEKDHFRRISDEFWTVCKKMDWYTIMLNSTPCDAMGLECSMYILIKSY